MNGAGRDGAVHSTQQPALSVTAFPTPPEAPPLIPSMLQLRDQWAGLRALITAGRREATGRQHELGKHTARERLDILLDAGSFTEIDMYRRHQAHTLKANGNPPYTDGVITGSGTIDGRRVFVYAQDFTIFGGSLGQAHAAKIHKTMDLALDTGSPLIGLNDSGGARIQEGVMALDGYGGIFRRNVRASGVIPQISVVLGPCAGGAAYSPALTDFTFMVRGSSHMYLTGPDVVAAVTGERVSHGELGGADVHSQLSGVATFVHDDEESCLHDVRYLLSMLPSNNLDPPPAGPSRGATTDERPRLAQIVPRERARPYDMRSVVAELVDDGEYLELHADWARNVICVLARIDGAVVGIVGNQPNVLAGVLDAAAAQKAARFVRFCDAFNIPLVTLVDVPGFLPGTDQEYGGVIRHGAKLLYAYTEATVPKITIITRKAYGGAYDVMASKHMLADFNFAWPGAEVAVMGPEGAVNIIYRRDIAASPTPDARRQKLIDDYKAHFANPYVAAERGYIDDVIIPHETRPKVITALQTLQTKRQPGPKRKHGNIPL